MLNVLIEEPWSIWLELRNYLCSVAKKELSYDYSPTDSRRDLIIEAKAVWKFVEEHVTPLWSNIKSNRDNWIKREAVLEVMLEKMGENNIYVDIVLMIESMPTKAFRRMLWGYNIDFIDTESFLRRLEIGQMDTIKEDYNGFWFQNMKPKAFSGRHKKITFDQIIDCDFDSELRYRDSRAMSYNLLNWDFGFNAYPKGKDNDEKDLSFDPLRFLSKKNHQDDFVGNKEDGKYLELYIETRSLNIFKNTSKEEIKLKEQVCPGFWYTAILYFLFKYISPLFLFLMIVFWDIYLSLSLPYSLSVFVVAVITPSWLMF